MNNKKNILKNICWLNILVLVSNFEFGCLDSGTEEKKDIINQDNYAFEYDNDDDEKVIVTTGEDLLSYIEWANQSKLAIDIDNYNSFYIFLQSSIDKSKDAYEKSFEGIYQIIISDNGTALYFNDEIVGDDDPLYIQLTHLRKKWESVHKYTDIENLTLSIFNGKITKESNLEKYMVTEKDENKLP